MTGKRREAALSIRLRGTLLVYMVFTLIVVMSIWLCSCEKEKESSPGSDVTDKETPKEAPRAHARLPRLVELGADKCIPCKMMAPILKELKKEYAGKLQIESIDVKKNPEAIKQYGIRVIPTQIFYDANGEEFQRHQGFMDKGEILTAFRKNGVDFTEK
ncbi:thioredoxin family protein [Candidatus Poribacteria bacterium]